LAQEVLQQDIGLDEVAERGSEGRCLLLAQRKPGVVGFCPNGHVFDHLTLELSLDIFG